jgi:L-amino acid N-acyltransferase YncA
MLRKATPEDAAAVARIYNHYIAESIATFETESVGMQEMADRIARIGANYPYFVVEQDSRIAGYCYLNQWNNRCAYRSTVEATVYVDPTMTGSGLGRKLYAALFEEARERHYHAVIAGISLPNPASVRLHESFGFEKVAQFRETGFKLARWIDVGYWELLLETEAPDAGPAGDGFESDEGSIV